MVNIKNRKSSLTFLANSSPLYKVKRNLYVVHKRPDRKTGVFQETWFFEQSVSL